MPREVYEPDNCCWATRTQQNRNRRNTKRVVFHGVEMPLAEACELVGFEYKTVLERINRRYIVLREDTQDTSNQNKKCWSNHMDRIFRIKPLVWESIGHGKGWMVDTPFGQYQATTRKWCRYDCDGYIDAQAPVGGIEAAKSAAEDHYRARLCEALIPVENAEKLRGDPEQAKFDAYFDQHLKSHRRITDA